MQKQMVQSTEGDVLVWSFSSSKYVQTAVSNVEKYLREVKQMPILKSMDAPISNTYCPEIDETAELGTDNADYSQSLIGVLW